MYQCRGIQVRILFLPFHYIDDFCEGVDFPVRQALHIQRPCLFSAFGGEGLLTPGVYDGKCLLFGGIKED